VVVPFVGGRELLAIEYSQEVKDLAKKALY
jgi:hypothetical protein